MYFSYSVFGVFFIHNYTYECFMFTLCTNFIVSFHDRFIFHISNQSILLFRNCTYAFENTIMRPLLYEFYDSKHSHECEKWIKSNIFQTKWTQHRNTIIIHGLNIVKRKKRNEYFNFPVDCKLQVYDIYIWILYRAITLVPIDVSKIEPNFKLFPFRSSPEM